MKRLWRVYRVLLRMKLLMQLQYRAAMALWMLDMVLNPLIYLVVWSTVARSNGGSLDGYTPGAFAAYFTVLLLVNHLSCGNRSWGMNAHSSAPSIGVSAR